MEELFQRISGVAMVIGIIICISSFGAFAIPGGNLFVNFLVWVVSMLFGISLVSIGGTRVMKEHEFYQYMRDHDKNFKK